MAFLAIRLKVLQRSEVLNLLNKVEREANFYAKLAELTLLLLLCNIYAICNIPVWLNFTENSAVNNYSYATFSVKFLFRRKCDLMFKQQYVFFAVILALR